MFTSKFHFVTKFEPGASKISLSTLSSENLWKKSGRLGNGNKEVFLITMSCFQENNLCNALQLFRLEDRKSAKLLLSPTHEEEITSLVSSIIKSYKDLPLRLYQISS